VAGIEAQPVIALQLERHGLAKILLAAIVRIARAAVAQRLRAGLDNVRGVGKSGSPRMSETIFTPASRAFVLPPEWRSRPWAEGLRYDPKHSYNISTKREIPTPALLVDLDAFEANLRRMADAAAARRANGCARTPRRTSAPRSRSARSRWARGRLRGDGCRGRAYGEGRHRRYSAHFAGRRSDTRCAASSRRARWRRSITCARSSCIRRRRARRTTIVAPGDRSRCGRPSHRRRSLEQALDIAIAIDKSSHLRLRGVQAYSVAASHAKEADAPNESAPPPSRSPPKPAPGMARTRPADRYHYRRQHGHVGCRSRPARSHRAPGGLLRADGHRLPAARNRFRASHDGARHGDQRQPCGLRHRGCRLQGLRDGPPVRPRTRIAREPTYRWGGDEFGYLDSGKLQARRPHRILRRRTAIPP
jgi:hypothetical protein